MKPVPRLVCLVSAILIAGSGLASAAPTSPVPVQFAPDIELSADKPATLYHIEPTIAADPRDPNHLVAGFFGPPDQATVPKCFAEVTFDAGATWIPAGTAPLASEFDDCADPSMAADLSGTFYYAYGTFRGTPQGYFTTLDIRVARSTDGGRSFPESSTAVAGGPRADTVGARRRDADEIAFS